MRRSQLTKEQQEKYLRENMEIFHDKIWPGSIYSNPAGAAPVMGILQYELLVEIKLLIEQLVTATIPPPEQKVCDYCGVRPAQYEFKNGKNCCEKFVMSCPGFKQKKKK